MSITSQKQKKLLTPLNLIDNRGVVSKLKKAPFIQFATAFEHLWKYGKHISTSIQLNVVKHGNTIGCADSEKGNNFEGGFSFPDKDNKVGDFFTWLAPFFHATINIKTISTKCSAMNSTYSDAINQAGDSKYDHRRFNIKTEKGYTMMFNERYLLFMIVRMITHAVKPEAFVVLLKQLLTEKEAHDGIELNTDSVSLMFVRLFGLLHITSAHTPVGNAYPMQPPRWQAKTKKITFSVDRSVKNLIMNNFESWKKPMTMMNVGYLSAYDMLFTDKPTLDNCKVIINKEKFTEALGLKSDDKPLYMSDKGLQFVSQSRGTIKTFIKNPDTSNE